jgi:hypothetical protein
MPLHPVASTGYWKYSIRKKKKIKIRTNKIKRKLEE